ncbi:MAG TPA: hypothetical protein VIK78_00290 [Ruminiclostridium sp.]
MILTVQEAADILKLENPENYPTINIILPAVDDYLKTATGKDWSIAPIDPIAKMTASILLVRWFEDSSMIGKLNDNGIIGLIAQLQAKI